MKCIIVGAGFGERHINWLSKIDLVKLEGLNYKNNKERALKIQEEHGFSRISDEIDALVAENECDLISVVSPPHTHLDIMRRISREDAAIVLDKPVADSEAAAQEIGRIADSREKPVFTFFQWRLLPAFRSLRDLVRSGELGPLTHIEAVFNHSFLADNATPWPWRHDARSAGAGAGALSDLGVHVFDLVRFVSDREWEVRGALCGVAHPQRSRADGQDEAPITCSAHDFAAIRLADRAGSGTVPCGAQVCLSRVALGTAELAIRLYGPLGSAAVIVDVAGECGRFIRTMRGQPDEIETFSLADFNPYRSLISTVLGERAAAGSDPARIADGIAAQRLMMETLSISQRK